MIPIHLLPSLPLGGVTSYLGPEKQERYWQIANVVQTKLLELASASSDETRDSLYFRALQGNEAAIFQAHTHAGSDQLAFLELAAVKGDANAQYHFGLSHELGRGTDKNEALAIEWYQKAAGQKLPEAFVKLGEYHEKRKNDSAALHYYKEASDRKHPNGHFHLGRCYFKGIGVSKNPQQTVFWFKKGAKLGDPEAQYYLGLRYINGVAVPLNLQEGIYWITQAANQGQPGAQAKLADFYSQGMGVPPDIRKAHHWASLAAAQGNRDGCILLGNLYYNGRNPIPKDHQLAAHFYSLAGTQKLGIPAAPNARRLWKDLGLDN